MPGNPAGGSPAPLVPTQVLSLLPAPHQRSIYYHPPAARNAARLAATFVAAAGREQTEAGLFRAFPDMGASTLHFYLARWRAAGVITARRAPELKTSSTGSPVLAYSLSPDGEPPLSGYVQHYIEQIEGLADTLRTVREGPGTARPGTVQVPSLAPLEARLLLFLHQGCWWLIPELQRRPCLLDC